MNGKTAFQPNGSEAANGNAFLLISLITSSPKSSVPNSQVLRPKKLGLGWSC